MSLRKLQMDYDEVVEATKYYMRQYDRSRDGTEEKQNARAALDRLNARKVELERKMQETLDS